MVSGVDLDLSKGVNPWDRGNAKLTEAIHPPAVATADIRMEFDSNSNIKTGTTASCRSVCLGAVRFVPNGVIPFRRLQVKIWSTHWSRPIRAFLIDASYLLQAGGAR